MEGYERTLRLWSSAMRREPGEPWDLKMAMEDRAEKRRRRK